MENLKRKNICVNVGEISSIFELCNNDLKKKYLIKNINTINTIMENTPGYCGSFGTGYPFYTLKGDLSGNLPIIKEQLRYNDELVSNAKNSDKEEWICAECLRSKGHTFPDLKQICKPCPQIENELKPRKILNRLPDIDMWMICQDYYIDEAKDNLIQLFEKFNMHTSDVNPLQTIQDVEEIVTDIKIGKMPSKKLPLDIHIIEYSKFNELLEEVPFVLQYAVENNTIPYLPIHPISLRKTWQYDDTAYNFILDFLFSMTEFNLDDNLTKKLRQSRLLISNAFTNQQLFDILHSVAPNSVHRRLETKHLQKAYERRIDSWKK